MKNRDKDKTIDIMIKITMAVLFTIGALIFSYPFISDSINNFYDQKMMERNLRSNNEEVRLQTEQRIEEMSQKNSEMSEQRDSQNIPGVGLVPDPFEDNIMKNENPGDIYFNNHLLGAIYIPKIKVSLPIFDETNDILLEKGATLLQGTSYPVGGDNTHSVITSHSGLAEKRLFTDLERLEEGDLFFVQIGEEILAYEIFQFQIVLPHEIEVLGIKDNEDLVTLLTCTPYMINTHRLLATGRRVEYLPIDIEQQIDAVNVYHSNRVFINIFALGGFLVLVGLWTFYKYRLFIVSKEQYPLSFTQNDKCVEGQEYILRTLIGRKVNNQVAKANSNGHVDFGYVDGGNYYIAKKESLKSRFSLVAKINKGRFVISYRPSFIKKEDVTNYES